MCVPATLQLLAASLYCLFLTSCHLHLRGLLNTFSHSDPSKRGSEMELIPPCGIPVVPSFLTPQGPTSLPRAAGTPGLACPPSLSHSSQLPTPMYELGTHNISPTQSLPRVLCYGNHLIAQEEGERIKRGPFNIQNQILTQVKASHLPNLMPSDLPVDTYAS